MNHPKDIPKEIIAKMHACGLGMRRSTVELSDHNPLWASAFSFLKSKIESELGNAKTYRIEHFGSTSILQLAAKPI